MNEEKYATKAPFPWFGGKSKAADLVWELLGDCHHYVEPFFGTGAVLLNRPHTCNRSYFSETVNDADGCLVNAWRAIQWHPEETARWASWPVTECDKQARQIAFQQWRASKAVEKLAGSWDWCDPRIAGFWLYGISTQIGGVKGPWTCDPKTGRIRKIKDILADPDGALPVEIEGVSRGRSHLINNGVGVYAQTLREEGVSRDLPHLTNDGMGVCNATLREEDVFRDRPHLSNKGEGVSPLDACNTEFHATTMPSLIRWFQLLSARLRHVRIVNGDWKRVCTNGAAKTLSIRGKEAYCGFFLDPPYDNKIRSDGLYSGTNDAGNVAAECLQWCIENGKDPQYRIVLAGYDTEHGALLEHGWTEHEWYKASFLSGGYGNIAKGRGTGTHQQHRERLWASPHTVKIPGQVLPQKKHTKKNTTRSLLQTS